MAAPKGNQGIYKIISPSGKVYIGQSVDIETRFKKYYLLHCKGQSRLYNSFKKHGVNNHVFEVIELCSFDDLNNRERFYQEAYDVLSDNGLNCQLVSTDIEKYVHSDETRAKISRSHKGKKLSDSHISSLVMAKSCVLKSTRDKISKANTGKKLSLETKEKMRKRMIGNKYTKGVIPVNARKVINTANNKIYNSITIAAEEIGVKPRTLRAWLDGQSRNKSELRLYYGS